MKVQVGVVRAAIFVALFPCGWAAAQDSAPASAPASLPTIDRIVDRANHQSPYFSAQGLKALKAQGAAALPGLERFVARRSILALAPLVVEWLGDLPDDGARAMLREGLGNRQFPWRPQAAKALARNPRASEIDAFLALGRDDLAAVREPALLALGELGAKDPASRARALAALQVALADPMFEPRLAACESLVKLGEKPPPLLLEALGVERRFFDLDFGVLARRRAWTALKPIVGEGTGYDPLLGRARNADALGEVAKRLLRAAESRSASLPADVDDVVFGLEVRSCRAGDQWVRITSAGDLVLGNYDLEIKRLDPKAARDLLAVLKRTASPSPESRPAPDAFFGRPGCDFEKWYLPDEAALLRLSVGLEGRPELLESLHKALESAIESAFGPARAQEFSDRAAPFTKPDERED